MKLKVFSVYDEKACAFSSPFNMAHKGQAMRAFQDLIQDGKSMVSKHPGDFKLYELGEFDDNSGKYVNQAQPVYICIGSEFVEVQVDSKK